MKNISCYLIICLTVCVLSIPATAQKPGKVRVYNFYSQKVRFPSKKGHLEYNEQKDRVRYNYSPSSLKSSSAGDRFYLYRLKFPGYAKYPYKVYKGRMGDIRCVAFYSPDEDWLLSMGHKLCDQKEYNTIAKLPSVLITYDKAKGAKVTREQIVEKIKKAHTKLCAYQNKVGKKRNEQAFLKRELPKSKMNNKDYEQRLLRFFKKSVESGRWKKRTFVKVIITSPEWRIKRHKQTGVILQRLLSVASVAKWPNGDCTYQFHEFKQDYTGGGQYQKKLWFKRTLSEPKKVLCSKVN
ncbi:hypothetical protein BKI52_23910 [marine bacterium AO1-C]|nr:hypothetical protein BKI52_23910 [marine bacterium AO1-C]